MKALHDAKLRLCEDKGHQVRRCTHCSRRSSFAQAHQRRAFRHWRHWCMTRQDLRAFVSDSQKRVNRRVVVKALEGWKRYVLCSPSPGSNDSSQVRNRPKDNESSIISSRRATQSVLCAAGSTNLARLGESARGAPQVGGPRASIRQASTVATDGS